MARCCMPDHAMTGLSSLFFAFLLLLCPNPARASADYGGGGSSAASVPAPRDAYDFDGLSNLVKRLTVLEASAPETLLGFYEPRLKSFSVKPGATGTGGRSAERVCITSTCYALLTLSLSSDVYSEVVRREDAPTNKNGRGDDGGGEDEDDRKSTIPIRRVMQTLLSSECRENDLFQIPLLLYTILRVDSDRSSVRSFASANASVARRLRKSITTVLKGRPQRRLGSRQLNSEYVTYQVCKVAALLFESAPSPRRPDRTPPRREDGPLAKKETSAVEAEEGGGGSGNDEADATTEKEGRWPVPETIGAGGGGLPPDAVPDDLSSELFDALLCCAEVSSDELCRQLAYRTAGDSNSFDVVRLAYSLLTYLRSHAALSGVAGKELVPGKGPSPETKVGPANRRLVSAALDAYFAEQSKDGLWEKGQPIYTSFARGKGRNMGNAFVFPVNTVGSLLCALPAESFRPYLPELERTLHWIETHRSVEMITDYCDPKTGQCYGHPLRGWTSPSLAGGGGFGPATGGPQAWPTAQVLKCVSWMRRTVSRLMHDDVLEEFHGHKFSEDGVRPETWDQLLDTDLGDPSEDGGCRTIKSVLEERVVVPFENSIDSPSCGAAYSAILFGPPGTAKTSICEALARRMGYDFVVIDTAAFLADGLTNVAARIRYVFRRLMALEKCVILFDEIEEFALDRETPGLSMESRMLTTAMLTAINDLRRKKKSIFFVATNRLKAFDAAITRPGRFDMRLFVGTPNLPSRVAQFERSLLSRVSSVEDDVKASAVESYRSFLASAWSKDAMFMNYLEGMQFAASCADVVASKGELTTKDMSAMLRRQAEVMTVRGSARDEYVASMKLSRL